MGLRLVRRTARAFVPVALVLTAGCGNDDDDAASTEGDSPTSDVLDGRTFVSTEVTGETLVEGSEIRLTFEGDRLSVDAGCNTINGDYAIEDGTMTVGPLAQTQMACEDERQQQDQWVTALLEGEPSVSLTDDLLTVSSGTTSVTLQES